MMDGGSTPPISTTSIINLKLINMGFDVYGKAPIVPKQNVKEINSLHRKIQQVQTDPDMDTADKHEKVWAYEQTIEIKIE